jgi:hypothetical protein
MPHVSLVLGLERSQLARSATDRQPLLAVCALFGTHCTGQDGVVISLYLADWPFAIFKILMGEHQTALGEKSSLVNGVAATDGLGGRLAPADVHH